MKNASINHYRNSFIDIIDNDIRILMDPWVNTANEGAWAPSKNGKKFILKSQAQKNIDYIYISHLHTDHFDKKFLIDLYNNQKNEIKIIIKKFDRNPLCNQLLKIFKKSQIIEIDEFKKFKLNKNSYITILPQLSASNTPSDLIKYDLDTSCIYESNNVKIFNQVDNPYSEKDIKYILRKLKTINIKNDFDICFLPYCAASEYPQMYFNLDRKKEKNLIIKKRLNKFFNISNLLNSKVVIPSGGTYKLNSFFSILNRFTAIPNFSNIKSKYLKLKNKNFKLLNGQDYNFTFENRNLTIRKNNFKKLFASKIEMNFRPKYETLIKDKFNENKLKNIIDEIETRLTKKIKSIYNKTNTSLEFVIYDKHPIKIKSPENYEKKIIHSITFGSDKNKKIKLKVHFYYKIFLTIVNKFTSWNELQAQCMFERYPNKYDPDTLLWINFFKKS